MRSVEVYPRLVWRCPSCDKLRIEPDVVAELTDEDKAAIEAAGCLDPQTGQFGLVPKRVKCRQCGEKFKVI